MGCDEKDNEFLRWVYIIIGLIILMILIFISIFSFPKPAHAGSNWTKLSSVTRIFTIVDDHTLQKPLFIRALEHVQNPKNIVEFKNWGLVLQMEKWGFQDQKHLSDKYLAPNMKALEGKDSNFKPEYIAQVILKDLQKERPDAFHASSAINFVREVKVPLQDIISSKGNAEVIRRSVETLKKIQEQKEEALRISQLALSDADLALILAQAKQVTEENKLRVKRIIAAALEKIDTEAAVVYCYSEVIK